MHYTSQLSTGQFLFEYFRFAPSGFVEITYLAPPETKLWPKTLTFWRPLPLTDPLDDYPHVLMEANKRGYGVYFGTTVSAVAHPSEQRLSKSGRTYTFTPRRKEVDACYLPALWVDLDDVSVDEGYQRLMSIPVMPSFVVRSGGGVHGYWLLSNPPAITAENRHYIKRTIHGLAVYANGDVKARDLARIMRVPGTVNTKPGRDNAPCEVIEHLPGRYRFDQLADVFSRYAPREELIPHRAIPTAPADHKLPSVTRKYLDNPPAHGERNARLYAAARGCNDAGLSQAEAEQMLLPVAAATGLEHYEAQRTITSAYRAAPSPIVQSDARSRRVAARDTLLKGQQ